MIGQVPGFKKRECLEVLFERIALKVNRAVPFESEVFECADDTVGGAGLLPWRINVFDSQQPLPRPLSCFEITSAGGQQGAKMQWTGWRWSARGRSVPGSARQ